MRTFCVLASGSFLAVTTSFVAQANMADDVYKVCSPIINAVVTQETRLQQGGTSKTRIVEYLCTLNFSTEEQAKSAGVDVNVVVDGVPIGAMYSSNSSTRSTARAQLCRNTSITRDEAWGQVLVNIRRDPTVADQYLRCVQSAMATSGQDLYCYSNPIGTSANSIATIGYQPKTLRTGKLRHARLTGPFVDNSNKTDVSDVILQTQRDLTQALHASQPVPVHVKRTGPGAGALEVAFDDGQSCTAEFGETPIKWSGEIFLMGRWLGQGGIKTFNFEDRKDCSDNAEPRSQRICVDNSQILTTTQSVSNARNRSSNCPQDASGVTDSAWTIAAALWTTR